MCVFLRGTLIGNGSELGTKSCQAMGKGGRFGRASGQAEAPGETLGGTSLAIAPGFKRFQLLCLDVDAGFNS